MKTKIVSLPTRKQPWQEDKNDEGKQRLSVAKCREILQKEGQGQALTDEEILKIRDYLYGLAAIVWEEYQQKQQEVKLNHIEQNKTAKNEESYYLRAS